MIENVMLIDDDEIDVYISKRIITKYDPDIQTRVFHSATAALSFFNLLELNENITSLALPDVILLDVNMPDKNGFMFLREFEKFKLAQEKPIAIYMLSSSISTNDILKAQKEPLCSGYITKPLTVEKLTDLFLPTKIEVIELFKKII